MIKAERTNKDTLDLQPTCNQLATDCISRRAAIEAVRKVWYDNDEQKDFKQRYYEMGNNDAVEDAIGYIDALPSEEPHDKRTETHGVCSSLISRQAAVAMFEKHCYPITYDKASREKGMTITGIREVLESLPSAPDSRQRGEWHVHSNRKIGECSECGATFDNTVVDVCEWDFCPNCGADMRGGGDET